MGLGEEPAGLQGVLQRLAGGEQLTSEQIQFMLGDARGRAIWKALTFAAGSLFSRQTGAERLAGRPGIPPSACGAGLLKEKPKGELIALFRHAAPVSPSTFLAVDGAPAEVRVSLEDLWRFYAPLCALLRHAAPKPEGRRVVVGIAGPPGSGKSVFAALLKAILDTASVQSAVVSLDGYHFPNAYLDTHYTSDAEGAPQPLRHIKGSPGTFDVKACADAVGRLHTEPALRLPAYDRLVHDPVEGRILVGPEHRLALVEGNYLLLEADGWRTLRGVLDLAIFLLMPFEAVRSRLIARHMRGGRSRGDAERHFELVDMGNWNLCMGSARRADLIVERDADFGIVGVEPPQVRPGCPAAEG